MYMQEGCFMTEHCVFCRLAKKEAPASYIYEDKEVAAFLDMNPINEGHTLVIPKNHYENIYEIPEEKVAHLFRIVKKIAHAVKKGVNAEGISIIQNNEKAAGQIVFHLHVHIVPRYGKPKSCRPREICESSKLDNVAAKIRKFV